MGPDFWLSRWQQNKIGFHQEQVNPYLQEYLHELGVPQGCRIFVPLCGKSLDMLWLRDQGYCVLGVELSQIAVESFFGENHIPVEADPYGTFLHYRGDSVEILCGDFFDLRRHDLTGINAVYDRAAFIALPGNIRPRYAEHLTAILPPTARMLLLSLEYPEGEMHGPPFSVPEQEIRSLFEEHFDIRLLRTVDALEENPRFKQRGITELHEKIFLLSPHR